MNKEELKQFIEENKTDEEVKEILKQYMEKPKLEDLLSDEDYAKRFDSLLDSERSKAVDSYIKNTLPKRAEEKAQELLKSKLESAQDNPWYAKVQELETNHKELLNQLAEKEKQQKISELKSKAFQRLSEKGLPTDTVDFLVTDDEERTEQNLLKFEESLTAYSSKIKESVYSNKNTDVPRKEVQDLDSSALDPQERMRRKYEELQKK